MSKLLKIALISGVLLSIFVLSAPTAKAMTIAEIQAQISIIYDKIQVLLKELAVTQAPACSNLWWIDNTDTTCFSRKQFCGTYMYQGLETYNDMHDCVNAALIKKAKCVSDWKCDWGTCENGLQPQIPIDSNKCGTPITQSTIACPYSTRQCVSTELPVSFTLLSADAKIAEYGLKDYVATGTIVFKVKLNIGTMQQFISVGGSLDKAIPMVVINAYDSNGQIITGDKPYRYIVQTPAKDLVGGQEATVTVQQTLNFSSESNIKSLRFRIDTVNYGANGALNTYPDIQGWYTNSASLPAVSQYRLNLMANIAEVIKNISQSVNQLLGL